MYRARAMFRIPNLILALSVAAISGLIALAGCSDDNNPASPPGGGSSATFSGLFSSPTQSGKLNISINTTSLAGRGIVKRAGRATVTCTGTIDLGASNVTLSGTYDTNSNQFVIAGGGYSFDGFYYPASYGRANLTGTWDGPGGTGGDFICYLGNSVTVSAYCGRYHSNAADGDSMGNWTFGVVDTLLAGYAFGDSSGTSGGVLIIGKISTGNPHVITINYNPGNYTLVAPGTIDTTGVDTVNGTFTLTDNAGTVAGTYTGSLCP